MSRGNQSPVEARNALTRILYGATAPQTVGAAQPWATDRLLRALAGLGLLVARTCSTTGASRPRRCDPGGWGGGPLMPLWRGGQPRAQPTGVAATQAPAHMQ